MALLAFNIHDDQPSQSSTVGRFGSLRWGEQTLARRLAVWGLLSLFCWSGPLGAQDSPTENPTVTPATPQDDATTEPTDWLKKYQDPQEFLRLCDGCRQRNMEMDDRSRALEHTETAETAELDKRGKTVAAEHHEERVWFEQGQEFRLSVNKEDVLTGRSKAFDPKPRKSPKSDTIYPFTRDAQPGMYVYHLEGIEPINDRATLRVRCEPNIPLNGKMRGTIWIDPESLNPIRYVGEVVVLPRLVHEMRIEIEFGPANNGHFQTRHSVVHVSGGLALIQKRYRTTTEHGQYRPRMDSGNKAP